MITGFNTDVDFQGVTYHVQTEDKGLATPFILSLVYNRGTILASKRSPYDDLVEKGFDEKVLAERLQKQHKTICAAIRAGKIEQLKEMTAKDSAKRKESSAREKAAKAETNAKTEVTAKAETNTRIEKSVIHPNIIQKPVQSPPKIELKSNVNSAPKVEPTVILPPVQTKPVSQVNQIPQVNRVAVKQTPVEKIPAQPVANGTVNTANKVSVYKGDDSPIPKPKYDFSIKSVPANSDTVPTARTADTMPLSAQDELIIEAVEIIEEEVVLADEAVEIVAEIAESKVADNNKMKLQILGDEVFKSGEKKTMSILVHRGSRQNGLSGAQVMVKVLGAAFRPLIFHGRTDNQGIAKVHLQMPLFKQGRAAILIKAMSEGEEIELRRTIKHK